MKGVITVLCCCIAIITQQQLLFGQSNQSSINMRVAFAPEPVVIGGKSTVYYELHLTSFSPDSIILKKLEVVTGSDSSVIGLMDEAALGNNLLLPGTSGVIYIECVLPSIEEELHVFHRLYCEKKHADKKQGSVVHGADVLITKRSAVVLGSPLKGGPWAAIYDPSWERGHRRVYYTVDGNARLPGRFAIDFIKLNARGKYADGNDDVITNWFGYNDDVLAVSDGVVASTRTDFEESATLKDHPDYAAEKATGNYVSIDIGNGNFAFYEHLRPRSIRVKPGQRVKKGEVIASVGFTGQTTGPHLHFHVADKDSALGAEGVPFAFESFTLMGRYNNLEKFGSAPWIPEKKFQQIKFAERPSSNSVIKFRP